MNPLPIDTIAPAVLGPESAGMLLTPEEFDAVTDYDDQFRYELIRGVLVVTPIPAEAEAAPNDELGAILRKYRHENPQGGVIDETLPERYIRTSSGRRRADRVIWTGLGAARTPLWTSPRLPSSLSRPRAGTGRGIMWRSARVPEGGGRRALDRRPLSPENDCPPPWKRRNQ